MTLCDPADILCPQNVTILDIDVDTFQWSATPQEVDLGDLGFHRSRSLYLRTRTSSRLSYIRPRRLSKVSTVSTSS